MAKQTQHGRYPVKGKEVAHDKFSSMACNLVSGFIPLASMALMNYAGVGIMTQMVTLSPVYLFLGGRWTLGYHNLLHQEKELNSIFDIVNGAGLGHFLTFNPAKFIHDLHHHGNYATGRSNLDIDTTQDYLTPADIAYRKKQIMKIDPDYWFKSSPNRWILFKRSSVFDLYYNECYLKRKNKTEPKRYTALMYFSRLVLLLLPFLLMNPLAYMCHLIMSRLVMSVIFMVFTTLAHEEGWFDSLVDKYYPFQKYVDINLVLEMLVGYHVHHVNEHDNHHDFPRRDVSMLAETSIPRRIFNFMAHCFEKFVLNVNILIKQL